MPTLREFAEAEGRFKESVKLRREGLTQHTYPLLGQDLETIGAFVNTHGRPPVGFLSRLWWALGRSPRRRPWAR